MVRCVVTISTVQTICYVRACEYQVNINPAYQAAEVDYSLRRVCRFQCYALLLSVSL